MQVQRRMAVQYGLSALSGSHRLSSQVTAYCAQQDYARQAPLHKTAKVENVRKLYCIFFSEICAHGARRDAASRAVIFAVSLV